MVYKFIPQVEVYYRGDYDYYYIDDERYQNYVSENYDVSKWFKKTVVTEHIKTAFELTTTQIVGKAKRDKDNNLMFDKNGEPIITHVQIPLPLEDYDTHKYFYKTGYDHTQEIKNNKCYLTKKIDHNCYILEFQDMDDFMQFTKYFSIDLGNYNQNHYVNGVQIDLCRIS